MKKGVIARHKHILTALKKAGYKVDNLERQSKKTVITISPVSDTVFEKRYRIPKW